jgi:hypothetical protein
MVLFFKGNGLFEAIALFQKMALFEKSLVGKKPWPQRQYCNGCIT